VINLSRKGWLDALLSEVLETYDPDQARSRLPADIRAAGISPLDLAPSARLLVARSLRLRKLGGDPGPPDAVFVEDVRAHLGLALDLALLRGEPFLRTRHRAELAAFLAAAVGETERAVEVEPEQPGGASDRAVRRALLAAGEALRARFLPPGDPCSGLPLHPGAVAILRRRLARVAMGFHRAGRLEPEALERHGEYATRESVLLAEVLSGLLLAAGSSDDRARAIRLRQLLRLGLSRADLREARRLVASPRPPETIAAEAPEPVRPFLFEQLLLAQLRARLSGERATRYIERFGAEAGLDPEAIVAAQVEAAAQHADHEVWFQAFDEGGVPPDLQALADEWESVADQMVERVTAAVTDNLDAMAIEIRQTGELGTLLGKAAAGRALTAEEKRKVKAQLIDLAKAVPALAIFAAPGGMLLLPLLAKLLPFNLLPSAWDKDHPRRRGRIVAGRVAHPAPAKRGKTEPAA
jgi:hypothetical protein